MWTKFSITWGGFSIFLDGQCEKKKMKTFIAPVGFSNPRPHPQPLPSSFPASNYYMNQSKKTSGFLKKKKIEPQPLGTSIIYTFSPPPPPNRQLGYSQKLKILRELCGNLGQLTGVLTKIPTIFSAAYKVTNSGWITRTGYNSLLTKYLNNIILCWYLTFPLPYIAWVLMQLIFLVPHRERATYVFMIQSINPRMEPTNQPMSLSIIEGLCLWIFPTSCVS